MIVGDYMRFRHQMKIILGKLVAKSVGYNKKYLTGKWFSKENNYIGWNWVLSNSRIFRKATTPWPMSGHSRVVGAKNIVFHPDDLNNFQHFGCYFQGKGKIEIGRGTYIAPNVGIITANHNIADLDSHMDAKDVVIGEKCWIGMNSVILPGVTLGEHTVVGAGSVVTKSFENGYCVIAGNPAKIIKIMERTNENTFASEKDLC